jgi:RNA-directed DNA polymerase
MIKFSDDELGKMWRDINFKEAESKLSEMQKNIAIWATKYKYHCKDAGSLQKKLINSIEAKVLAVRQVSNNAVTPGCDKILWKTDAEKMRAVMSLNPLGYKAQPSRFVVIRNKGDKERHIQLPNVYDRAMQVLFSYALDPVAESTADKKSFSARRGRSSFDLHAYIMRAFESKKQDPPWYVVKADVRMCYASISHKWLLKNIPMNTYVLKQFLESGYILNGVLFSSEEKGISLGTSISPILANMTLDGLQIEIYNKLHGKSYDIDHADGNLIRFADDMLITARTEESAKKILQILKDFLELRGLELSPEKTKIIDIRVGFDFLSRNYKYDKWIKATPSSNAVKKMEQSLKDLICDHKGSQKKLIEDINHKLTGWASYHKVTEAKEAFQHIDNVVRTLLLEFSKKLHPKMPIPKVINKYFYQSKSGKHVYFLAGKLDVRVLLLEDVELVNHIPISLNKNPYIDKDYYKIRMDETAIMNITGKYKSIWERQEGKCFYCGRNILIDQRKTIVFINPERASSTKNSAYVHECCSQGEAEFLESGYDIYSQFDLFELLTEMKDYDKKNSNKSSRFNMLMEHIRKQNKSIITLKFKDIENINGLPLCKTAYKEKSFWYQKGVGKISYCWLHNGYKIKSLNMEKNAVILERFGKKKQSVKIPEVFLSGKVPPNAKAEFEIMCGVVMRKYGL